MLTCARGFHYKESSVYCVTHDGVLSVDVPFGNLSDSNLQTNVIFKRLWSSWIFSMEKSFLFLIYMEHQWIYDLQCSIQYRYWTFVFFNCSLMFLRKKICTKIYSRKSQPWLYYEEGFLYFELQRELKQCWRHFRIKLCTYYERNIQYCWFSLSRHKKVNPKLLSEKTQEYYRL